MQCDLTKYIIPYPLETKEAKLLTKALAEVFILKHGLCQNAEIRQRPEFNSKLFKEICKPLSINKIVYNCLGF